MASQRILFVDDELNVLRSYERSLRGLCDCWEMEFESSPTKAWGRIQAEPFDAIVTDVRMPDMTGIELLAHIKGEPDLSDLPVVIVTGEADRDLKRKALDLDAADLLNKPVHSDDLIARLRSVLRVKQYADELKRSNERLEQRVEERTAELVASRVDILWRLGKAAEYRDEETGNHVIRVGAYSRIVAKAMGNSSDFCDTLFLAAPLHDIGKIGVADHILLKPGKLTDEEWTHMRGHCEIGVAILSEPCKFMHLAAQCIPTLVANTMDVAAQNPIIEMAADIAASHHEKWDGSGYPNGIAGEAIPLAGRIVAIADVYDALRSERPYKKPFSIEKSLEIIRDGNKSHFDPNVVEAFLRAHTEIQAIEQEFGDSNAHSDAPVELNSVLYSVGQTIDNTSLLMRSP